VVAQLGGLGKELAAPHRKRNSFLRIVTRGTEQAGSCEHGNEPSGIIKGGKFLDWLRQLQLLKKDSASCS